MIDHQVYAGGCLCGAVRFEARGEPTGSSHCHCEMCRRASGAPVVTFIGFAKDDVTWKKGAPKIYKSSSFASRGFCPDCGSQLTFQFDKRPEDISFNVGCLDDPELAHPTRHLFAQETISWMKMDDGLPRQEGGSGGGG
jgi:hypothetical protein